MVDFRRGTAGLPRLGDDGFHPDLIPMAERESLARDLLDEFGGDVARETSRGELIHSCVLPFGLHKHGDRNPSARLNWKKLVYRCEVCGDGGLLWFIATCRDTDSAEAKQWLAERTGSGGEQSLGKLLDYLDALFESEPARVDPMPTMNPRVLEPWRLIHPYLTEVRGVPEQTIIDMQVGWNPESNRIIIPHFWRGDLVGWQSRRLLDDDTPKYKNSPSFPKDRTLYNDGSDDLVLVVESPMSVLRHQGALGVRMLATFGANITIRQTKLLAEHRDVILWLDPDEAGWRATRDVGEQLLAYSTVWVVDNPWAADPGDLPEHEVRRLLDEAKVPYSIWEPRDTRPWEEDRELEEVRRG